MQSFQPLQLTLEGWRACITALRHQPPAQRVREVCVEFYFGAKRQDLDAHDLAVLREVVPMVLDRALFPDITTLTCRNLDAETYGWVLDLALKKSRVSRLVQERCTAEDDELPALHGLLLSGRMRCFSLWGSFPECLPSVTVAIEHKVRY